MNFVVVTSIASPNKALRLLAEGCKENNYRFIVIGDKKSPCNFDLEGCSFYSLEDQFATKHKLAELIPVGHYARKNIGYLLALNNGAKRIIETDDDNIPYESFWQERKQFLCTTILKDVGWVNIYRYFSDQLIWPRGFPLEYIHTSTPSIEGFERAEANCPIQQGLANSNPDVDAVYRLVFSSESKFINRHPIAVSMKSWCPFNSQNTTWFPDAFRLLYLPSYCSFRMTDIWRSFIAQVICWVNDWCILFHEATVFQERNEHNLMRDFQDEIPGYLWNKQICDQFEKLPLKAGIVNINNNMVLCYDRLISLGLVDSKELDILEAWLQEFDLLQS